jgi:hypothetical protein
MRYVSFSVALYICHHFQDLALVIVYLTTKIMVAVDELELRGPEHIAPMTENVGIRGRVVCARCSNTMLRHRKVAPRFCL